MPNASDNARVAIAGEARRRNVNGAMANEAIGTSYPRQDRRESSVVAAFGAISLERDSLSSMRGSRREATVRFLTGWWVDGCRKVGRGMALGVGLEDRGMISSEQTDVELRALPRERILRRKVISLARAGYGTAAMCGR